MILKVSYYEKEVEKQPHHSHIRVLEVCDFHIGAPEDKDEPCSHEIVYHTLTGQTGVLLVGRDKENADHVYVMEKGKTADHMRFYAN